MSKAKKAEKEAEAAGEPAKKEEAAAKEVQRKPAKPIQGNVILVGKKPIMNYVLACITQLSGAGKEVELKARGRAISRAVDVVEILRNRFITDLKVKSIEIGTETVTAQDGSQVNVSAISIKISR